MAPATPDRQPGNLQEDGEVLLGANPVPLSAPGAIRFDGTSFEMRDAAGTFNPRTGVSVPDSAWRRHFLLMGG
jgi:hypothetical protein